MSSDTAPESSGECPRWSEALHDRSHVLIRPVRKQDRAAERAFIEALSPEARLHRFMHPLDQPDVALVESLVDLDRPSEMAYVAVVKEDSHDRIVGTSQYAIDALGACRCWIVVADEWKEKGLGTLLLRHLLDTARHHGIGRVYFVAYVENIELSDLLHQSGFHTRPEPDHPSRVIHELMLVPGERGG